MITHTYIYNWVNSQTGLVDEIQKDWLSHSRALQWGQLQANKEHTVVEVAWSHGPAVLDPNKHYNARRRRTPGGFIRLEPANV